MNTWLTIPDDVVAWFRSVFANANRRVYERLVIRRDGQQAAAALHRTYNFDETRTFAAMKAEPLQVDMRNRDFGKAVFCLLYAPHDLPYS